MDRQTRELIRKNTDAVVNLTKQVECLCTSIVSLKLDQLVSHVNLLPDVLENIRKEISSVSSVPRAPTEAMDITNPPENSICKEFDSYENNRRSLDMIHKLKTKMKNDWSSKLNAVSSHHFQKHRNLNIAIWYNELCKNFTDNQVCHLPKKFRPKAIKDEPEDQTILRIELAFNKMKVEAEIMYRRSKSHHEKIYAIKKEMTDLIAKESPGPETTLKLTDLWEADVSESLSKCENRVEQTLNRLKQHVGDLEKLKPLVEKKAKNKKAQKDASPPIAAKKSANKNYTGKKLSSKDARHQINRLQSKDSTIAPIGEKSDKRKNGKNMKKTDQTSNAQPKSGNNKSFLEKDPYRNGKK